MYCVFTADTVDVKFKGEIETQNVQFRLDKMSLQDISDTIIYYCTHYHYTVLDIKYGKMPVQVSE